MFALVLSDESLLKEAGRWESEEEESEREDKEEVDDEDDGEEEGADDIVEEMWVKLSGFPCWAAAKEHSPSRGLRHPTMSAIIQGQI